VALSYWGQWLTEPELRLYGADGELARTLPLSIPGSPPHGTVRYSLAGEVAPGEILVTMVRTDGESRLRSRGLVADLAQGTLREVGEGLRPSGLTGGMFFSAVPAAPGSPGTRMFLQDGALVEVDPHGGARRVLLPRR
jgi:hypothetical protein